MTSKRLLRTLLVAEFILGILLLLITQMSESAMPKEVRAYINPPSDVSTKVALTAYLLFVPVLLAYFAGFIGLFFFWRPARSLYLITTILSVLLTPFSGPDVATGLTRAFDMALYIISGIILGLINFSPLREEFVKTMSPKQTALIAVALTGLGATFLAAVAFTPDFITQLLVGMPVFITSALVIIALFRTHWLQAMPPERQNLVIWAFACGSGCITFLLLFLPAALRMLK